MALKAETPGTGNLSGRARVALELVCVMALDLKAEAIKAAEADPFLQ